MTMSKNQFVIDSSILIAHLRGDKRAKNVLSKVEYQYISTLTATELFIGAVSKKHLSEVNKILKDVEIVDVSLTIAKHAAFIIRKNPDFFGKKVLHGVIDAFIVATGIYLQIPILTLDKRHFSRFKSKEIDMIVLAKDAKEWKLS